MSRQAPIAPNTLPEPTVEFFKDKAFKGTKHVLFEGKYPDLTETPIGIDSLSSLKVLPGAYVLLFRTRGYRDGSYILFEGEYPDLSGLSDEIDSVQVFRHDSRIFPIVRFYSHPNFEGVNRHFAATQQVSDYSDNFLEDRITSARVPEGVTVILFRDKNQQGPSLTLEPGDYKNLGIFGFNDIASSIRIVQNELEVVDVYYPKPLALEPGEPIVVSNIVQNASSAEQQINLVVEQSYEESFTRSFENSTLVGLQISTTASAEVSSPVGSASIEQTLTATLENTFTVGREEAKTRSVTVGREAALTVPPGTKLDATLTVTPSRGTIEAWYTLRLKGTNHETTQLVTIEAKSSSVGELHIQELPLD